MIYLEIRCDGVNGKDRAEGCWAEQNKDPDAWANNNQRSVVQTVKELSDEALSMGYIKKNGDWMCSVCAAQSI